MQKIKQELEKLKRKGIIEKRQQNFIVYISLQKKRIKTKICYRLQKTKRICAEKN